MSSLVGKSDSESKGFFSSVAKMRRVSGVEWPEVRRPKVGLLGFHSKLVDWLGRKITVGRPLH